MYCVIADNVIDKEEYRKAYTGFGLPAEQCDKAYDSFTNVSLTSLCPSHLML